MKNKKGCNMEGLGIFGFWIFLAVFVACDTWIFREGYDSVFHTHATEQELELQRLKIEEKILQIKILNKNKEEKNNTK